MVLSTSRASVFHSQRHGLHQDDDFGPSDPGFNHACDFALSSIILGLCKQEGSDNIRSVVLRSYDKTTAHDLIAYLRKELEPKDK